MRPSRYDFPEPVCSGGWVWRDNWRGTYKQLDSEWNVPLTARVESMYATSGEVDDVEYDMLFGGDGNHLYRSVPGRKARKHWFHSGTNLGNALEKGPTRIDEWYQPPNWEKGLKSWKGSRRDVLVADIKVFGDETQVYWYERGEVTGRMSLATILEAMDKAPPYVHVPTVAELRETLASQRANLAMAKRQASQEIAQQESANRYLQHEARYLDAVIDLDVMEAATKQGRYQYRVTTDGAAYKEAEWEVAKDALRERVATFKSRWDEHAAGQAAERAEDQAAIDGYEDMIGEIQAKLAPAAVPDEPEQPIVMVPVLPVAKVNPVTPMPAVPPVDTLGVGTAATRDTGKVNAPPERYIGDQPAKPPAEEAPKLDVSNDPANGKVLGYVGGERTWVATAPPAPVPSDVLDLTGVDLLMDSKHLRPVDWDSARVKKLDVWVRSSGTGKVRVFSGEDLDGVVVDFGDVEVPLKRGRQGFYFANLSAEQVAEIRK